jgi:hypothetical protein
MLKLIIPYHYWIKDWGNVEITSSGCWDGEEKVKLERIWFMLCRIFYFKASQFGFESTVWEMVCMHGWAWFSSPEFEILNPVFSKSVIHSGMLAAFAGRTDKMPPSSHCITQLAWFASPFNWIQTISRDHLLQFTQLFLFLYLYIHL